ncbi:MAG: hypothetical protein M3447_05870 [Acidobacteriota bacterium]|nr:hypothetical protein [Acidobacteriota bacterium]
MKNKSIHLVTVLALCSIAFSLAVWATASERQQVSESKQTDGTKRKTFRDLARERDIEVDAPQWESTVEYRDLGLLARHAEAIVVGRLTDEQSTFSGDDYIITTHSLAVQRVIKATKLNGPLAPGDEPPAPLLTPMRFVRPGGAVVVNGHLASQKWKGSEPLETGSDVLLLLWWSPDFKAYTLAGGLSGALLIDQDLRVKPLSSNREMLRYTGASLDAVINEVLAETSGY